MIKIKIGQEEEKKEVNVGEPLKLSLQIRKSLDGKLIINDHEDLDIVIDQDKQKILVFSTDMKNSDKTYFTQDRFFKHMIKKGIIAPESVMSSNIYGCIEGAILQPKNDIDPIDVSIIAISNWIDEERPAFLYQKMQKEEFIDDETHPDTDETTPLGKVKQKSFKHGYDADTSGVMNTQRPYEE